MTLPCQGYSKLCKQVHIYSVGAISESRRNTLIVGNRSSLLQLRNVALIVIFTISSHIFCRSDLRIATKHFDSRESEFPPAKCQKAHLALIHSSDVKLIVKSTIKTPPIRNFLQKKKGSAFLNVMVQSYLLLP